MKFAFIDASQVAFPIGRDVRRSRSLAKRLLRLEETPARRRERSRTPSSRSRSRRTAQAQPQHLRQPARARELRARGLRVSKKRVERLMRENGLQAPAKATFSAHHRLEPREPDRAERRWHASSTRRRPNEVWVTDVTYVWTDEGWLYLAIMLDLFVAARSRLGDERDQRHCPRPRDALDDAMHARHPAPGLVHHSDRGSPYASERLPRRARRSRHRREHEPHRRLLGQ